jgi:hypothetical protein
MNRLEVFEIELKIRCVLQAINIICFRKNECIL